MNLKPLPKKGGKSLMIRTFMKLYLIRRYREITELGLTQVDTEAKLHEFTLKYLRKHIPVTSIEIKEVEPGRYKIIIKSLFTYSHDFITITRKFLRHQR